jgi:hypothetical protein
MGQASGSPRSPKLSLRATGNSAEVALAQDSAKDFGLHLWMAASRSLPADLSQAVRYLFLAMAQMVTRPARPPAHRLFAARRFYAGMD